jgi:carbonic anhydrase
VQWFIADSALVVRVQDRDAFRQVYDGNNRPLQSNPNPVTATDGAGWGAD